MAFLTQLKLADDIQRREHYSDSFFLPHRVSLQPLFLLVLLLLLLYPLPCHSAAVTMARLINMFFVAPLAVVTFLALEQLRECGQEPRNEKIVFLYSP